MADKSGKKMVFKTKKAVDTHQALAATESYNDTADFRLKGKNPIYPQRNFNLSLQAISNKRPGRCLASV